MKKNLKVIRLAAVTAVVMILSQGSVFAEGNQSGTSSDSLTGVQVIGAFILLLAALLLPLVKKSNRQQAAK